MNMARLILVILVLANAGFARAQPAEEAFNRGAALFAKGDYAAAIEAYGSVTLANPALEYNRGLAYLKLGRLGKAVVHFERALRLDPSDEDARYNLELIRAAQKDRLPSSQGGGAMTMVEGFYRALPLEAIAMAALGLWLVAWALGAALILARGERRSLSIALAGAAAAAALWIALTAARIYEYERGGRAVAVVQTVDALAAPSQGAKGWTAPQLRKYNAILRLPQPCRRQ
ncbi:MAG: tetratricopeptide repeat protein [Nitrospinae bacterium]|nr:tetratricopeptide repeat protein [Nitrospinota bacterium]